MTETKGISSKPPGPARGLGLHGLMTLLSLGMVVPFAWMVLTSLKSLAEVGDPAWLPKQALWGNYPEVFSVIPFLRFMANSVVIAGWVTLLQVFTSALAAFSFARLQWPGRDRVFFLYLGTMMLPGLVMLIPNFQLMVRFGLVDSYLGLVRRPPSMPLARFCCGSSCWASRGPSTRRRRSTGPVSGRSSGR